MCGSKTSQCGHESEEQQAGNRESFHGFGLLFSFEALEKLNLNTDLILPHWYIVATNWSAQKEKSQSLGCERKPEVNVPPNGHTHKSMAMAMAYINENYEQQNYQFIYKCAF